MPKSFYTKLKGVSKKNEDGRSRQEVIEEDLYEGLELHLEREPDNPNDSDAIAVFSSEYGDRVGYISGDLADQLAPQMDRGQLITCQVTEITGDYGQTRGVNVLITVYTLAESKLKDELGKAGQPASEPAPATEEQKFIPEPPKPAEEVPQPSSQVNEWRATKAYTPSPVLRATETKRKPTLKQRWLALPKKARTWIIIILVILLIYFFGR